MALNKDQKTKLDTILHKHGFTNYRWFDPRKIIVAQWVRMKCMFGCGEYGRGGACPPNVPSVTECERFFKEYTDAAVLHFEGRVEKPEDRHDWSAKINARLVELERAVFLAGHYRAFQLFMDSCGFCKPCTGRRRTCEQPSKARPTPEAMAVDVYATVRQFGLQIDVRTDYDQKMDRYAFLMVR